MKVKITRLPKKAQNKISQIRKMIDFAEDLLYIVVQVDYRSGMIKFESMQHDNLFINYYSTSNTVTIESRDYGCRNGQTHHKKCFPSKVRDIFSDPIKFIN